LVAQDTVQGDRDVTGISYNGQALTEDAVIVTGATNMTATLWFITEASYGADLGGVTANVSVTHGGKTSSSWAVAVDLIGVDQSSPKQDNNTAYGTGTGPTVTVAGAISGSMTLAVMANSDGDTAFSVTAGTEMAKVGFGPTSGGTAYRADSGTVTWLLTYSANWHVAATNFNEATGGPAIVNIETAMAVTGALTAGVSHLIPIAAAPGGSSSLQAVVGNIIPVASAMDVIGGLVADVSVLGAGAVLQAMYLYRRRRT